MDLLIKQKLDRFFNQFEKLDLKKGAVLISAQDETDWIYYLTKGRIRQYTLTKSGEEVTLNFFKPVSFFPIIFALNGTRNRYYFESAEYSTVWKAPKDKVITYIKQNPDILFDLTQRLSKGLDGILKLLENQMSADAYKKLIHVLLIAYERFDHIHFTHKELAQQAGITRETVTRELKILKNKGLIKMSSGNIQILNQKKLDDEYQQ